MDSYSYSRLDLYGKCPLAFRRRYIEKRPEEKSAPLELGTEVHAWIAAYNEHLSEAQLVTDLDFLQNAGCSGECREILDTFGKTHMLDLGNNSFEQMWEIRLADEVKPGHYFTWRARIDRAEIDESYIWITDYKSDHALRSQANIESDFQLKTYAWITGRKWPDAGLFRCELDFVRHGVSRIVEYTRDDLPEIEAEILRKIYIIEADTEFAPTPGPQCEWCSWTHDCSAIRAGGLEVLTSADDALELATEKIVLEARLKKVNSLLQPHCTAEGPIDLNGLRVGYHRVESYSYPDLLKLQVALTELHLEMADYVRADSKALKAAAKKTRGLAEALAEIATDHSYTRFETRKVKV